MDRDSRHSGDPTPVTGGMKAPARLLRHVPKLTAARTVGIDKHIIRLLALHRDVARKFAKVDLQAMDNDEKRALLDSINRLLGIQPRN